LQPASPLGCFWSDIFLSFSRPWSPPGPLFLSVLVRTPLGDSTSPCLFFTWRWTAGSRTPSFLSLLPPFVFEILAEVFAYSCVMEGAISAPEGGLYKTRVALLSGAPFSGTCEPCPLTPAPCAKISALLLSGFTCMNPHSAFSPGRFPQEGFWEPDKTPVTALPSSYPPVRRVRARCDLC